MRSSSSARSGGVLPLAVASNAPRSHLLAGLRRNGLEDAFDAVLGVDDVENPKPSPDLYLRACELLGVLPAKAVALEDSPPGVAAARAAGLLVVGVPSVDGVELAADVVAPVARRPPCASRTRPGREAGALAVTGRGASLLAPRR